MPEDIFDVSSNSNNQTEVKSRKKRSRVENILDQESHVRHKVNILKGNVQCLGTNRKKRIQCRNAALMEYIGPRPIYCAQHISLDPNSLYTLCASPYYKIPDDSKGCHEVVLKEFRFCFKHYSQLIEPILNDLENGQKVLQDYLERVNFLLEQLYNEASQSKYIDHDLFERKQKLIPKFVNMKETLLSYLGRK